MATRPTDSATGSPAVPRIPSAAPTLSPGSDAQRATAPFFHEQAQFRPPSPPLTPGRTTAPDETDAILEEALEALQVYDRPAAAAKPSSAEDAVLDETLGLHQLLENMTVEQLEAGLSMFEGVQSELSSFPGMNREELARGYRDTAEIVTFFIGKINIFFQDLIAEPDGSLASWLAQAAQEPQYKKFRPFYTSSLLQNKLPKLPAVRSCVDGELIDSWTKNYMACLAKLRSLNLQQYIEEAPTAGLWDQLKGQFASTSVSYMIQEAKKEFKKTFHGLIEFEEKLLQVGKDPVAIRCFLEIEKQRDPNAFMLHTRRCYAFIISIGQIYQVQFEDEMIDHMHFLDLQVVDMLSNVDELKCYLEEPLPPAIILMVSMAGDSTMILSGKPNAISTMQRLIPLCTELAGKVSPQTPLSLLHGEIFLNASQYESHQCLYQIYQDTPVYFEFMAAFRALCKNMLAAGLKPPSYAAALKNRVTDIQHDLDKAFPTASPSPAPIPAAASSPSITAEQIKRESEFLIELNVRDDKEVEAWLKQDDREARLLRCSQILPQLKTLMSSIDRDVLLQWRDRYNACIEKLKMANLQHLIPKKD